jgi:hypothetical protein
MTRREKVKFLHGPYVTPKRKRCDRATCLLRAGNVVVTGMSSGRIPWPRLPRARQTRRAGAPARGRARPRQTAAADRSLFLRGSYPTARSSRLCWQGAAWRSTISRRSPFSEASP